MHKIIRSIGWEFLVDFLTYFKMYKDLRYEIKRFQAFSLIRGRSVRIMNLELSNKKKMNGCGGAFCCC